MVLLIGNFLSGHGANPTAIEDLAINLSSRYEIKTSSSKKNSLFRLIDMAYSVLSNRRHCNLIIVDVFSTNAFIFSSLIVLIAKFFTIPYVPVFRGGNLPERYKKHPDIFKFLFSDARIIICPSNYLQEFFKDTDFPITIIPNYIDLNKYNFKKRKNIKPQLLWVRSIHKIYNPSMAIYVLDKIRKLYSDAQLCMVGPVKDNKTMEKLTKMIAMLNLQDHVTFSGQLSKKDWTALSEDYDIFINTTDYDNNPITLLEAMALGMPIVSTNVGGLPYLINDNVTGLLVAPNDSDQMSGKIIQLISGEIDGKHISKNARIQISEYDKKYILSKWDSVLSENLK